jgi:hypothetical protein
MIYNNQRSLKRIAEAEKPKEIISYSMISLDTLLLDISFSNFYSSNG